MTDEFQEVRILRLEPDDIVVLAVKATLNARQVAAIRRRLREKFPNHGIMVLSGAELSVLRKDDA
jgi:hypothetical protein